MNKSLVKYSGNLSFGVQFRKLKLNFLIFFIYRGAMKLALLNEYKLMKWKNGLGETYEIDIFPKDSSLNELNFDYRISIAKVLNDNEFSLFPGYERSLTILTKAEGFLNEKLLTSNSVVSFSGREKTFFKFKKPFTELLDLGIIYRPQKITAKILLPNMEHEPNLISNADKIFVIDRKNFSTFQYDKGESVNYSDDSVVIIINFLS